MGKRKNSTTTIIVMLFLLIFSLPALAALTTTQMRENSIRINALELKNIDILNSEAPKEMTIVLDERALNFDFDKSNVKPEYYDLLKNIKEFVEQNNYEITIVGHTDSVGSNAYNFKLSRRRAESVKAKLLEFGLSEDRIVGIEAMGEEQPIATNETKEGRAQNRRVEFKLVQRETVQGTTATPKTSENK
ncbi:OmpA family protein [Fusobacterium polymorphum]|uniref:OmpA family protein n=1 Tax=Fusobacterium nucleatum subsp. polymorphum TaxID=76857 RepID=UPI0030D39C4A